MRGGIKGQTNGLTHRDRKGTGDGGRGTARLNLPPATGLFFLWLKAEISGFAPNSSFPSISFSSRGFVLLEVMLGVTIFAVGVLGLGQCVNNCVQAEMAKNEDRVARIALSNRLSEIEGGSVDLSKDATEELKGMFKGISLKQQVKPVTLKNDKNQVLDGLREVNLEAVWKSGKQEQSKALSVYVQIR